MHGAGLKMQGRFICLAFLFLRHFSATESSYGQYKENFVDDETRDVFYQDLETNGKVKECWK